MDSFKTVDRDGFLRVRVRHDEAWKRDNLIYKSYKERKF